MTQETAEKPKAFDWREVLESAQRLQGEAGTLAGLVERAMQDGATQIEAQLEELKAKILAQYVDAGLSGVSVPKPAKNGSTKKVAASVRGRGKIKCDICESEGKKYLAKNDAGLAIHKGRTHGTKASREQETVVTPGKMDNASPQDGVDESLEERA